MTLLAMFGSGLLIIIKATITVPQLTGLLGKSPVNTDCFVAARSTTALTTAGRPTVAGARRATVTATGVCVLWRLRGHLALSTLELLPFTLFLFTLWRAAIFFEL